MVQWLRLGASTAGGEGSIPGQRTKIPKAAWCVQENKATDASRLGVWSPRF